MCSLTLTAVQIGQATAWAPERSQAPAEPIALADLPRGPDDCLEGETFVLTGQLPHLSRYATARHFFHVVPSFAAGTRLRASLSATAGG